MRRLLVLLLFLPSFANAGYFCLDQYVYPHVLHPEHATAAACIGAGYSWKFTPDGANRLPESVLDDALTRDTELSAGLAGKEDALVCTADQIKKWGVSGWECAEDSGTSGGAVDSVNDQTGVVVLDADDIAETPTRVYLSPAQKTKLDGIAEGAEVNVQSDWNAVSGDALILNKPTTFAPSTHNNTAHSETYITGNQSITLSGDVSGTGTTAITVTIGADSVALGTDTTGNYVSGATANGGLTLTGTEGATLGMLATCGSGQVLKWNGSAWACADDGGGGGTAATTSVDTTSFGGIFSNTTAYDTVQETLDAVDDYAPAWADITGIPAGFADGTDDTDPLDPGAIFATDYNGGALDDTTINAALTAIGSGNATLVLSAGNWAIDAAVTVPANVKTYFATDAVLVRSAGADVTFNGPVEANPTRTIFSGFQSGEVTISAATTDVYCQWFGLVSGDSTDDSVAANACFGSLSGGQDVIFPAQGDYDLTAEMQSLASNINVYFRGSSFTTADNVRGLNIAPVATSYTSQSISFSKGSISFTVPGGVTVAVGDVIRAWNSTPYIGAGSCGSSGNYCRGVMAQVIALSGSTATISEAALESFTATNIDVYPLVENVLIDGGIFDCTAHTSASGAGGLRAAPVKNVTVQNSSAYGGTGEALYGFNVQGINNTVKKCFASGFRDASTGYGILYAGSYTTIEHNTTIDCRHHITTGDRFVFSTGSVIQHNWAYNATDPAPGDNPAVLDTHANSKDVLFFDNYVNTTGWNVLAIRGSRARIVANTFIMREHSGTPAYNYVIYQGEGTPEHYYFAGNYVDVDLYAGDTFKAFHSDTYPTLLGGALSLHGNSWAGDATAYSDSLNLNGQPEDNTAQGILIPGTVAETVVMCDSLFLHSDGKWYQTDSNVEAEVSAMQGMATKDGTGEHLSKILMYGVCKNTTDLAYAIKGAKLYAPETVGEPTTTIPADTGDFVRVLGWVVDTDTIWFQPDTVYVER